MIAVLGSDAAVQPIAGDPSEYSQRAWTTDDGLPSNKIQALCQTRDGYIWIGTRAGLVRFDGLSFTVFNHINTPEMTSDDCRALAEDTEGALWIGTGRELLRFHQGLYSRYGKEHGIGIADGDRVSLLYVGKQSGTVWTQNRCFQNGSFRDFVTADGLPYGGTIRALAEDTEGSLWIGRDESVYWTDRNTGKFVRDSFFSQNLAMTIYSLNFTGTDEKGWGLIHDVGSPRARLYRFDHRAWAPATDWLPFDLQGDPANLFLKLDRVGHLWFPALGGNMHRFQNDQLFTYPRTLGRSNDPILCLLEDREGNLWLGTDASGLHRWRPRGIRALTTRDGLPDDQVWTVFQPLDDSVWVGTQKGAVQMKDGQFRCFTKTNGLSKDDVKAFAENDSGLWIGTGAGLNLYRDGAVQEQPVLPPHPHNKIRALAAATNGVLWIGTVTGLHEVGSGQLQTWRKGTSLTNYDVRALLENPQDGLWIGTHGGGLQRFQDGRFEYFTPTNGFSSDSVWTLYRDNLGVLWIGAERGLTRLQNGKLFTYGARNGLFDASVNQILEDDFGNLWLGSDHGVHRVSKEELTAVANGQKQVARCISYDESDGLPVLETSGQVSQPAACKTRDGRLWFSTPKGVVIIEPRNLRDADAAPLMVVEELRAINETIYSNRPIQSDVGGTISASPVSNPVIRHFTSAISLRPGSGRTVEFHYTANTFASADRARFRYRLEGYEEEWHDAATRRIAYYTNLRPGKYQFHVLAANHHGIWNEAGAVLPFSLAPFYWQTWWFRIGCGTLVAALLGLLVAWRYRELRRVNELERQNALEQQKRMISRDLHDEIGASLTQIARIAAMPRTAEASDENARISEITSETIGKLSELVWCTNPHFDNMPDLIAYLREYAARYIQDAGLRAEFEFPEKVQSRFVSSVVRRQLLLVLKEALNNVAKHAGAKTVQVRLVLDDSSLALSIADDGQGMKDGNGPRFGNGLANMRERVEELRGDFKFDSTPGRGTRLEVSVPLT